MVVEQDKVVEQEPFSIIIIKRKIKIVGILEPNRPPLLQSGERHRKFKDISTPS
jgi:hypothetical protein